MNAATNSDDWARIEPLLDEAIETLDETDRAAVILRYFENKSMKDVGDRIGASENAAQKRLTRAIDRLRDHFTKNGVTITSAAVVATISANAAPAAPAALASAIATAAGAAAVTAMVATGGAAGTGVALGTIPKTILATVAAGAIAMGVVEESRISNLRTENERLQASHAALVESAQSSMNERDFATNGLAQIMKANEEINNGGGELHRLRAEVVRLRAEETRQRALSSEWGKANESLRHQINTMTEQMRFLSAVHGAASPRNEAPLAPDQQCINNLRQIDGATEQWALENRKPAGTEFRPDDIKDYVRGQQIPKCPSGGEYTFGRVDTAPTCSVAGHAL